MTIHLLCQQGMFRNGVGAFLTHLGRGLTAAKIDYEIHRLGARFTIDDFLALDGPKVVAHTSHKISHEDQIRIREAGAFRIVHATTEHDNAPGMNDYAPEKTIAIRRSIQERFKGSFFLAHPFVGVKGLEFPLKFRPRRGISIARVTARKRTKMLLEANQKLVLPVHIYGDPDRMYVHFQLKELIGKGWHADKPYEEGSEIPLASGSELLFNLTKPWKGDGGGTEYAVLFGLYAGCRVIVHEDWLSHEDPVNDLLHAVGSVDDIIGIMTSTIRPSTKSHERAKEYLEEHHRGTRIAKELLEIVS